MSNSDGWRIETEYVIRDQKGKHVADVWDIDDTGAVHAVLIANAPRLLKTLKLAASIIGAQDYVTLNPDLPDKPYN